MACLALLAAAQVSALASRAECAADRKVGAASCLNKNMSGWQHCVEVAANDYDCRANEAIVGVADLRLSNGQTSDVNFTLAACQGECTAQSNCKSFVFSDDVDRTVGDVAASAAGYCELWTDPAASQSHLADHENNHTWWIFSLVFSAVFILTLGVIARSFKGNEDTSPAAVTDELKADGADGAVAVAADEGEDLDRARWGNKTQYILANIGMAVGLGNVWRFPYLCYHNGGGAFLIPYVLSLIFLGVPIFLLEMAIGQRFQLGAHGAWTKISPLLSGLGLASLVVSLVVGIYYNVIIMWAIMYFFNSFNPDLPWDGYNCVDRDGYVPCQTGNTSSPTNFWYHEIVHASGDIEDTGPIEWKPTLCLLFSWIIIFVFVCKGIQSSGKAMYFTATFPYLILVCLFIKSLTLEGAGDGIEYYLKPDFDRLSDPLVWLAASGQIFYSLGLGFGGVIAFSSFNPKKNDCFKDCFVVAITNCCTSVFAGFVVFAIIGHMAHLQGVSVANAVDAGPGLVFIVFPQVLAAMDAANFWAICFFFMLFLLGLGSQFGCVDGCVTVMMDMKVFPNAERWQIAGGICFGSFIVSLIFMCHAGLYYFEVFDAYGGNLPLFVIGMFELIAVSWVYGVDNFVDDINEMTGRKLGLFWWYCWKWLSPTLIFVILVESLRQAFTTPKHYDPGNGLVDEKGDAVTKDFGLGQIFMGWTLVVLSVAWIPAVAVINKEHFDGFKALFAGVSPKSFFNELRPSTSAKKARTFPFPVSGLYDAPGPLAETANEPAADVGETVATPAVVMTAV